MAKLPTLILGNFEAYEVRKENNRRVALTCSAATAGVDGLAVRLKKPFDRLRAKGEERRGSLSA